MAKYDVFALNNSENLVVDVQAELLDGLNTRVVIPLIELSKAPKPASRLNPVFEVDGTSYVLVTQFLAAVPCSQTGRPIANLSGFRDEITNALDMVFQGF